MTDPDLAFIRKTRGHHRAQVTKKCSLVRSDFSSFSKTQVLEYRSSLKDLKDKLDVLNEKVACFLKSEESETVVNDEFKSCDNYNDQIIQCLALLDSDTVNHAPSTPMHSSSNIKYPQLPLPHYSHSEGESLEKLFKDFEKAMQTVKVDSYIQFIYLKDQLKGQPLALVKSLSSTEQTYEEAKNLLQKAFGSDTMLKFETMQSLCELK